MEIGDLENTTIALTVWVEFGDCTIQWRTRILCSLFSRHVGEFMALDESFYLFLDWLLSVSFVAVVRNLHSSPYVLGDSFIDIINCYLCSLQPLNLYLTSVLFVGLVGWLIGFWYLWRQFESHVQVACGWRLTLLPMRPWYHAWSVISQTPCSVLTTLHYSRRRSSW